LSENTYRPIKTFVYHDFNDYLAGLLARSDLEELMDERCDQLRDSLNSMETEEDGDLGIKSVDDVFDANFLKTFYGPSPDKLFVDRPDTEGRYAFALNVDFFNPEGLSLRGAKASCGIIAMACLNLPLDIRYKPENMYLAGIIPGPNQPHLTELNHYIRPLINDLKTAWTKGVRFSRTARQPAGRIACSAIVLCVCDLPGACKLAQLTGEGSHFYCSVCSCHHRSTTGRTDYSNWKQRDPALLRNQAEMWKSAASATDQQKLFDNHGVRWSELWHLPYWDPTRQLVVDSMHCLLEGLVGTHIRDILRLTSVAASEKDPVIPAFHHEFRKYVPGTQPQLSEKEAKQVSQIHALLVAPIDIKHTSTIASSLNSGTGSGADSDASSSYNMSVSDDSTNGFDILYKRIFAKNLPALRFVCMKELSGYAGLADSKKALASALVEWVCDRPLRCPHFLTSNSGEPNH